MSVYYFGINRTLCSVLEGIRKLDATKNYSSLLSLVEEAQFMADRMEAGLEDVKDHKELLKEISELKKERRSLMEEVAALEIEKGDNDDI